MSAVFINKEGVEVERTRCEIYTRVMGYHRPVTSFNIGKKSEFYSRNYFKEANQNLDFINKYC
ncbi:MAG: anaerobic ribonucleoside-triphosphate reductase [Candidatus Gracilibacteria bacterium]|nr:anaerobic ribonucleoside-triphosphate reductase [Candidatus Gracilibacteria bacterium]